MPDSRMQTFTQLQLYPIISAPATATMAPSLVTGVTVISCDFFLVLSAGIGEEPRVISVLGKNRHHS